MNGRSASKTIFLFFLIIVIIILQLLSSIQSNRFGKKLDSLEKAKWFAPKDKQKYK
jgi:DNA-binding transcriptional regulator of glucitol operon